MHSPKTPPPIKSRIFRSAFFKTLRMPSTSRDHNPE